MCDIYGEFLSMVRRCRQFPGYALLLFVGIFDLMFRDIAPGPATNHLKHIASNIFI